MESASIGRIIRRTRDTVADQACSRDYALTDPLATVSVLTNAATHELKCFAARSLLRGDCAAAPTTNVVHQITVAARCVPEELAGGHEAAATNSLRDGATTVAAAASREGFHGRRGVAATVGSTFSRAASIAREPRKGSPRAAILRHSYHLRCENRSQPENQG